MIICPDTDLEGVSSLAESLRIKVEKYNFSMAKHIIARTKRVDAALYKAKDTRNFVYLLR